MRRHGFRVSLGWALNDLVLKTLCARGLLFGERFQNCREMIRGLEAEATFAYTSQCINLH